MHYPPLYPMKMTLYKKRPFTFSVYVFSRNKVVHVDYFECVVMPFFFISELCNTPAMMFSGCDNISDKMVSYHSELSVDSVILTVCDKTCSTADQNLTEFRSYEGREKTKL